jgi:uncharacterized membrane protein
VDAETSSAKRPRPRIESLSDLIFGLALSIGAFALVSSPPRSVLALYSDILTFAFNFVVLISVWIRYTRVMSVLPLETGRTTALNILLLFTVSVEPFLFNILRSVNTASPAASALLDAATSFYGFDLGVMILIMGVFTITLADEERNLVPRDMTKQLRSEAFSAFVAGAIFLVSALPLFGVLYVGDTQSRTDLWVAALVLTWVRRGVKRILPELT